MTSLRHITSKLGKKRVLSFDSKKGRNITVDTDVLIEYLLSRKEGALTPKAIQKIVDEDRLMLTDVILHEAEDFADKKKSRGLTREGIRSKLVLLAGEPIVLEPIPSDEELGRIIEIEDPKDRKIVYSSNMTDSVILLTSDHHFYRVVGLKARVLKPDEYLYEDEFPEDYDRNQGREGRN